jgi:hypothetical protein
VEADLEVAMFGHLFRARFVIATVGLAMTLAACKSGSGY